MNWFTVSLQTLLGLLNCEYDDTFLTEVGWIFAFLTAKSDVSMLDLLNEKLTEVRTLL